MTKKEKTLQEKVKHTTGRMKVHLVMPYKDSKVYVRQFDEEIFTWDFVWKGEIYSSYMVITPTKENKKLLDTELREVVKMCYAGACASIDMLRGDILDKKTNKIIDMFEGAREQVEKLPN